MIELGFIGLGSSVLAVTGSAIFEEESVTISKFLTASTKNAAQIASALIGDPSKFTLHKIPSLSVGVLFFCTSLDSTSSLSQYSFRSRSNQP